MTTMDAIARGWLVTVAADHFWRVAHWYDFEDLIQDGHVLWWHVVNRYERETGRVRSRPHLMRLFKTSYLNHIHRLSNRKTACADESLLLDAPSFNIGFSDLEFATPEYWDPWGMLGLQRDIGDLDRFIMEAPGMLRALLTKLVYEIPSKAWLAAPRRRADGTRDTFNKKLCRVVGIDPDEYDLDSQLRAYLRP